MSDSIKIQGLDVSPIRSVAYTLRRIRQHLHVSPVCAALAVRPSDYGAPDIERSSTGLSPSSVIGPLASTRAPVVALIA